MYDSMNPIRHPKEVLLRDWARRGISGTKGDRLNLIIRSTVGNTTYLRHQNVNIRSISHKKATPALLGKWNANKII